MESLSAGSSLSSTRLYTIIRASAGFGWVKSCMLPLPAAIIEQAILWWWCRVCVCVCVCVCIASNTMSCLPVHAHAHQKLQWIQYRVWLSHSSRWLFCAFLLLWQKMEAAYYDNIIEQQRIEPEFFRMGFYGRKFPFFLRVRLSSSSSSLSWHSLWFCWSSRSLSAQSCFSCGGLLRTDSLDGKLMSKMRVALSRAHSSLNAQQSQWNHTKLHTPIKISPLNVPDFIFIAICSLFKGWQC